VYALGVVLYEILTGKVPFEGKSTREILNKVIGGDLLPVEACEAGIPPELAAIVGKAMWKDKGGRYADVKALAEEVQRFQSGALVGAYQYGRLDLVTRFVQRHRSFVLTAATAMLLIVLVSVFYAIRMTKAQQALIAETERAESERSAAQTERERALAAEVQAREQGLLSYTTKIRMAADMLRDDPPAARAMLLDTPPPVRGWEWSYLMRFATDTESNVSDAEEPIRLGGPEIVGALVSSDGTRAIAISNTQPQQVVYWDMESVAALGSVELSQPITNGALSENGRYGVAQMADGAFGLWNLDDIETYIPLNPDIAQPVLQMAVDNTGSSVIIRTLDDNSNNSKLYFGRRAELWTWVLLADDLKRFSAFDVSPDWRRVGVLDAGGAAHVYTLPDGTHQYRYPGQFDMLRFSAQGDQLCLAPDWNAAQVVHLIDPFDAGTRALLTGFIEPPTDVAFSASGSLLCLGFQAGGVLVYRTHEGDLVARIETEDMLSFQFGMEDSSLMVQEDQSVTAYRLGPQGREAGRLSVAPAARFEPARGQRVAAAVPHWNKVLVSSGEGFFVMPLKTVDARDLHGFELLPTGADVAGADVEEIDSVRETPGGKRFFATRHTLCPGAAERPAVGVGRAKPRIDSRAAGPGCSTRPRSRSRGMTMWSL